MYESEVQIDDDGELLVFVATLIIIAIAVMPRRRT